MKIKTGKWLESDEGHTVKRVSLDISNVEYEWIHKRAKRNDMDPEDLVRSFLIKAIVIEEADGLTVVRKGKNGWEVRCAESKRSKGKV